MVVMKKTEIIEKKKGTFPKQEEDEERSDKIFSPFQQKPVHSTISQQEIRKKNPIFYSFKIENQMKIKVNWRHGEYSEDQKHNQKKYLE